MKYKICHVTSSHNRYDGRIFEKECCSLSKKYDTTLLCSDLLENEVKNNVKIISVNKSNLGRINRFFIIPKLLKKYCISIDADIYHFHDPELISLAYKMKKLGKKVIFDSHEDNVNRISNRKWIPFFFRPLIKKIYEQKEKKVFNYIDGIITVTNHIYARISKINSNSVIITNFPIYKEINRKKLDYNNNLCFAGTVSRQYMHHNIIKALDGLDVKYVIAGKSFDKYLDLLKSEENYNKVEYLGKISKKECDDLYLKSNIGMVLIDYVPNINYQEGSLGITKIFEYMQFGLPVIATDLNVWKEIGIDKCGILVNPNNIDEIKKAIEFLISNPEEAERLGHNGINMVKNKYNWSTQEKILFDFYSKIIKERKLND